jgi:hypothetical protein
MSIATRVKSAGSVILGLAAMIVILIISSALLVGAATFSVWVLKWTFPAFMITLLLSFVVPAPLSLIPPTRALSAVGFLIASFAFGAILWIWGMAYSYSVWGLPAVIIGLFFAGIGVVPIAMIAALLHADWGNLGLFAATAVITLGYRGLAHWLAGKADERAARLEQSEITIAAHEVRE